VATFVIVHGAWGGGWEWTPVANLLRASGHHAYTPTLTGMGERAHLCCEEPIGLATHIADIVGMITIEDLHDVVLCGASYGGMPVTGAADRLADRVRMLVYIDALVPEDGQSALDLLPAPFGDAVRAGLDEHGAAWRIPIPADLLDSLMPAGSLAADQRASYIERIRDHPAATFLEPVQLTDSRDLTPRVFIRCTTSDFREEIGGDPIAAIAERARALGWEYHELTAPHDPQVYNPTGIADLLDEIARLP